MSETKFLRSLLLHKWYVIKAGLVAGVPLGRLLLHDQSKFSRHEFRRYARWHHGRPEERDKADWALAWHHHLRHNPHHPEHWLLAWHGNPDFYAIDGVGERVANNVIVLPMPDTYVREMVADWLAAGKVYTGRWDMADWLAEHGPQMRLHDTTVDRVHTTLHNVGYYLADETGRYRPWHVLASGCFRQWLGD